MTMQPSRRGRAALAAAALLATACSSTPGAPPVDVAAPPEQSPSPTMTRAPERDVAPDFTLPTLNGGEFTLSDHRGKQPVVLKFWAPW